MAGRPPNEPDLSTYPARVGAIVRARREKLKKSGDEAAEAAGVPRATWYAWEAGRSLTLQQLPKIAKALGCKVRTLLPDE